MALTRITKGVIKPNENYDTHNINSTGIVTAIGLDVNGNGDISGNLNVGGVLTYEDVTSIDSVGIITAQSDIHVGGGVSAVGVGTFGGLDINGNGDISGNLDINGDLDVDGHTNLDNVSIAGVTTITSSTFPLVVHADTSYQGILVHGNGAPTVSFAHQNTTTPDWKIGLSGGNHTALAISEGTGNTNRFTLSAGGGGSISGTFLATNLGIDGYLFHNSDTDTKLQFGTDTIYLHTGGSSRISISNTGVSIPQDLDVDGHTNLDNVSIAGVVTATSFATDGGHMYITNAMPALYLTDTNNNPDWRIQNVNGTLSFIDATNSVHRIEINTVGNVSLSNDLDVDGHTNLDNVSIAGVTTTAGTFNAANIVQVGTTNDSGELRIGHDGSNYRARIVSNSSNRLTIDADGPERIQMHGGVIYIRPLNSEVSAAFVANGAAELYHNNIKTFETTNEGATFDTGSSSCVVRLTSNTDAVTVLQGFNSDFYLKGPSGGNLILYANGNEDAVKCIPNGAVELYHNGNRQVFTIDGGMNWQDSKKAEFGNSGDLKIYHESGVNYIYGATASPIAFMAQADEKLRINTNGRVGIGTNNPQQLLDLYDIQAGASGSAPILNIRNGYAGTPNSSNALKSEIRFSHRNHNSAHDFMATRVIADTSDNYNQRTHLRFLVAKGNNGTERLTISPDGYVGINDSTPQYPLDIQHDGGNQNQTPIIRLFQSSDGCHNAITLESSTSADKNIGIQFKNRNAVRGGIGYNQSDKMSFYSGTTPGGNGITINASGFVGINKSDPDRTFHVYRNSETWPAGFETNNTTCKISFKSAGTTNMYDVGVGAESRSLIFLTANAIRNDITTDGVMRTRTLGGGFYPVASVRDGSTSARAAQSAWEIKKTLGPAAHTGYYYLKNPYDDTVSQWWCDMETDGGGWILVAHVGDGQMSSQSTADGNHWYNRSHKGGFDTVGSGYYKGGGYWRKTNGGWGDNTCGQLMWDVRTQDSQYDNYSNAKVVFNWGTDNNLPTGGSNYTNIPGSKRFNEWCYEVVGAPGFNPSNYHQNARSNVISGANYFTEHMVITWSFRGTGGGGDDGNSPYWMLGSHHDGLHQHYEESLSGNPQGVYGSGGYYVVSNEDTGWGGGGSNDGYSRIGRHTNDGTCNVWLR